jgi:hypothetical protein
MTTTSVRSRPRMTVAEFLAWSADQPDEARHELVPGRPVRLMACRAHDRRRGSVAHHAARRRQRPVELYSRIASIRHDLVIEQDQHRVIDHGRGPSGGVEPRILREGDMIMEPPGIPLALADLCRDTTLGNAAPQLADR